MKIYAFQEIIDLQTSDKVYRVKRNGSHFLILVESSPIPSFPMKGLGSWAKKLFLSNSVDGLYLAVVFTWYGVEPDSIGKRT